LHYQYIWHKLRNTDKPIVIYGMGNGSEKVIDACTEHGIPIKGIFASDGFVRNQLFRGFTVRSYNSLVEELGNDFIILFAFSAFTDDLLAWIKKLCLTHEVYAPDFDVFSSRYPTPDFMSENRHRIEQAYALMADERSKEAFRILCEYKLTGRADILFNAHDDPDSPFESFFRLSDSERFVDLGAYRGDTVESFLRACGGSYSSIDAFEPDPKNFSKLKEYADSLSLHDITLHQNAAGLRPGKATFTGKGGRASHFSDEGYEVECVSIDCLPHLRPTFIKMDVEGAEADVIMGAADTIRRFRPKLQVSLYHKIGDFFELPLLIDSLCPGYKYYLRMFPYIPAWDIMLFVTEE